MTQFWNHILHFSYYRNCQPRIKRNKHKNQVPLQNCESFISENGWKIRPVLTEKKEFEFWDEPVSQHLYNFSDNRELDAVMEEELIQLNLLLLVWNAQLKPWWKREASACRELWVWTLE